MQNQPEAGAKIRHHREEDSDGGSAAVARGVQAANLQKLLRPANTRTQLPRKGEPAKRNPCGSHLLGLRASKQASRGKTQEEKSR